MTPLPPARNLVRRSTSLAIATISLVAFLTLAPSAYSAPKSAEATNYAVVTLDILNDPGSSAVVRRANSLGEVVGGYKKNGLNQASAAFLLSATGLISITDQQITDFSASYGINDQGEIAGAMNGPNSLLPFRSVRHNNFQMLPLLGRDTSGAAYGINSQGEAVGFSGGTSGVRAVWWTRKGEATALESLPGTETTKAIDINTKGDVVGFAGEGTTTAVLWPNKGGILPLDTLATYTSSQADSISDKGDVVGSSTAYDPSSIRMRAVLWPAGSTAPRDLGALPGGSTSRARDVDVSQNVIGTSDSSAGNHAFIWSSATGMVDLNSLSADQSIVLVDALSITQAGTILAVGIEKSDYPPGDPQNVEEHELPRHIVLLTPIK